MNIEYRMATIDDLAEIQALIQNAISSMEEKQIFQWDPIYPTVADFEEDINKNSLYLGISEGIIAVVFALSQESDDEYRNGKWMDPNCEYYVVHRLCVNCRLQNKGIGRQTMQYIEDMLKQRNIHAIRLDVFAQNPYALNLYFHIGYRNVGEANWRKGKFYLMEKYI